MGQRQLAAPMAVMAAPPTIPVALKASMARPASSQLGPNIYISHQYDPTRPNLEPQHQKGLQMRSCATPPPKRLRAISPPGKWFRSSSAPTHIMYSSAFPSLRRLTMKSSSDTPSSGGLSYQSSSVPPTPSSRSQRAQSHRRSEANCRTTKAPSRFPESPCCNENPAFFSGHTNVVEAFLRTTPEHGGPVRKCENRNIHREHKGCQERRPFEDRPIVPHHVCERCHELAWRHLVAVRLELLRYILLPLCNVCADLYLKKRCKEANGQPKWSFGCSCLDQRYKSYKFLCFDCCESALLKAKARPEAEKDIRHGCYHCGSNAKVLRREVGNAGVLGWWFVCPGCKGVGDILSM